MSTKSDINLIKYLHKSEFERSKSLGIVEVDLEDFKDWYHKNSQLYDELRIAVEGIIKKILDKEGLEKGKDYALLDGRLKNYRSFIDKMHREDEKGKREYSHPSQLTDIAGIRVVGHILSNVDTLCLLIERFFNIDNNKTVRPSDRLGENQVGYRSINYIAKLNEDIIAKNPQYEKFKDLYFEIQVKTLLDFAWQEIEHDRAYKTSTQFPKKSQIKRKFNLLSGLLEIADDRFEVLSQEVDKYDKKLMSKIEKGELEDLEISPRSLRLYLKDFHDIPGITPYFTVSDDVLEELEAMGIKKISLLDKIVPKDFKDRYAKVSKPKDYVTYTAIIRSILIIHNTKQYFEKAFKQRYYDTFDYHDWKVHKEFGVDSHDFPPGLDYDEGSDN
jgi:putative GTP pyrophosphokinase